MNPFYVLGSILVILGIALSSAKWFLGYEDIGSWPLVAFAPGLLLNWLGRRREKQISL
ncbi:hypothetical protein [Erythrobacter fulvus]|uniref:hypothetical protein n=1 Tax=Erythrobacter fulvus TaxID=2987523 RepID=UPI00235992AF|nr:hypothetical protein [Erythrobacter fulvus]